MSQEISKTRDTFRVFKRVGLSLEQLAEQYPSTKEFTENVMLKRNSLFEISSYRDQAFTAFREGDDENGFKYLSEAIELEKEHLTSFASLLKKYNTEASKDYNTNKGNFSHDAAKNVAVAIETLYKALTKRSQGLLGEDWFIVGQVKNSLPTFEQNWLHREQDLLNITNSLIPEPKFSDAVHTDKYRTATLTWAVIGGMAAVASAGLAGIHDNGAIIALAGGAVIGGLNGHFRALYSHYDNEFTNIIAGNNVRHIQLVKSLDRIKQYIRYTNPILHEQQAIELLKKTQDNAKTRLEEKRSSGIYTIK